MDTGGTGRHEGVERKGQRKMPPQLISSTIFEDFDNK